MDFDLDEDERALMDEINVVQGGNPQQPRRPAPSRQFRRQQAEEFEDDDINAFVNSHKMEGDHPPPAEEWDGGENPEQEYQARQNMGPSGPSEGYKTIDDEKADLLNKISRLVKKGIQSSAKLTIYSNIEDIRAEFKRMTYSIQVDQSVKFQRRLLVACVSGIEFLNKKFDPFDLELDGWSENVMESQEDYDPIFEELYAKYKNKVNVAPEIKLMFMVGGSAMMFHLSKSMFKKFMPSKPEQQTQQQDKGPMRREMRGPGIDLNSLGGGLDMGTLMSSLAQSQMNQNDNDDAMSDIISISSSGIRDIDAGQQNGGRKRKNSKKTKELVL
jgi:hypothetical protein